MKDQVEGFGRDLGEKKKRGEKVSGGGGGTLQSPQRSTCLSPRFLYLKGSLEKKAIVSVYYALKEQLLALFVSRERQHCFQT